MDFLVNRDNFVNRNQNYEKFLQKVWKTRCNFIWWKMQKLTKFESEPGTLKNWLSNSSDIILETIKSQWKRWFVLERNKNMWPNLILFRKKFFCAWSFASSRHFHWYQQSETLNMHQFFLYPETFFAVSSLCTERYLIECRYIRQWLKRGKISPRTRQDNKNVKTVFIGDCIWAFFVENLILPEGTKFYIKFNEMRKSFTRRNKFF